MNLDSPFTAMKDERKLLTTSDINRKLVVFYHCSIFISAHLGLERKPIGLASSWLEKFQRRRKFPVALRLATCEQKKCLSW